MPGACGMDSDTYENQERREHSKWQVITLAQAMTPTTTALVILRVDGRFELQEIYPNSSQPDETLVEMHASGICITDVSWASGE